MGASRKKYRRPREVGITSLDSSDVLPNTTSTLLLEFTDVGIRSDLQEMESIG